MGYEAELLEALPEGVNLGLGCGNPIATAELREGESVLDLGSGPGMDCFLAAKAVGPSGQVIGIDMTPEMIDRAQKNATALGLDHVEFRLAEIEDLPLEDESVDVVLSNCVLNLSTQQKQVYREVFRVLRPGGRLSISDIIALQPLPSELQEELALYTACIAGAVQREELLASLKSAGFEEIEVEISEESRLRIDDWLPGRGMGAYVASAQIRASKPI